MQPFTTVSGIAVPLRRSGVDTDQICPSRYMKRITRTGYDDALFATWRTDEQFILNTTPYSDGTILLAGADFGIGSSREHAVWALWDYGFRAVVSPRFADIFRSNALKAGLLAAQVDKAGIEHLWAAAENHPNDHIQVDLHNRTIAAGATTIDFEIDDHSRDKLLAGLDDIDITLHHTDDITAYEQQRPAWKPRVTG
ncbi:3-isopropylmalate dehydratase small subunit [Williamsia phyllosphaerae]|uniref:3-isopropylmalate dehydratase small subunit n=1 Tax=Williamsia phyllosphaerae TaxID=885042 RepID=A0ABQ1U8I7_9NOCA|nr:3-isopropylmalate dehydratase small subunit [Williamsia phyllosphaerae]GGF11706.1 3-isopropylmalate dehydratase small subunit [Williamsia phyllosphaerae]